MSALDNAVAPDNLGEPADRLALEGTELSGDLSAFVDTRTHILERRRTMAKIRRRGWLIRRMLLVADVVGLVAAFVVSEAELGRSAGAITSSRILLFVATLPGWILTATPACPIPASGNTADQTWPSPPEPIGANS